MKISKKALMVIGAGVFIIAVTGLVLVSLRQMDERDELTNQLLTVQTRLQGIQLDALTNQLAELEKQARPAATGNNSVITEFSQPVTSTAIAAAVFDSAKAFGLMVNAMSSTSPEIETVEGASLSSISVTTEIEGNASKTVDFIRALNNTLKTSAVTSVEMNATTGGNVTAIIKLVVYNYSGD